MSSLRSAISELTTEDLFRATTEQVQADVVEMCAALNALEAETLRRLAILDTRQAHTVDGYLSTGSWLAHRTRMDSGTARIKVKTARALDHMPVTREAMSSGDLSHTHVRVLVGAKEQHEEAFAVSEATLVEAAMTLQPRMVRKVVAYWSQNLDQDATIDRSEAQHASRRLHASSTLDGMVRVDGMLDPEGGEVLLTALRALTDPAARADHASGEVEPRLTPTQRRADALVDVCRHFLDRGEAPVTGGERPHVTLTVSLAALEGRDGGACELDASGVVTPEAARRIVCDAGVSRVITGTGSDPLDVGRRTRTVPPALRRALVVRDGGCRFPGCRRLPRWCDAHHLEHWLHGGDTKLSNLVLLCRSHHRLMHEGGFVVGAADGGGFLFKRPDGTSLGQRSPPVAVV